MSTKKTSLENENQPSCAGAVRCSKIKIINGTFVKEPKCKICNVDITHEWLGGDYTLLMCDKKECWDELNKRYEQP